MKFGHRKVTRNINIFSKTKIKIYKILPRKFYILDVFLCETDLVIKTC